MHVRIARSRGCSPQLAQAIREQQDAELVCYSDSDSEDEHSPASSVEARSDEDDEGDEGDEVMRVMRVMRVTRTWTPYRLAKSWTRLS